VQTAAHALRDLIDIERLQRTCDSLFAAGDVALAVLEPGGTVLVAAGWQDICTRFHRAHEETLNGCLESDLRIDRRLAEGATAPGYYAYRCANGLWDVALPLIIDGEHLANVFTGQFFYEDDEVDTAAFRERARRLGFDEAAYMDALARVPVLSHERVARTIGLLGDLVGMLVENGLSALQRERDRKALRESEERYRQLFEAESDAVFLIDNETGRILEANSAAAALYGYSRDELLGLTNKDLSAEPEETQAVTHRTPAVAGSVVSIPLRIHRKKDGSDFPVEITGRFFTREGRAVHVAAIRDISARGAAEDALRLSEDRFAKAFHGTPDAILITRARDGRIVEANDSFIRLTGYSREESLAGTTVALDLWADPSDRERCIAALEGGDPVRNMELDFRAKSGAIVECLYSGAIIEVDGEPHVLSVVHDTTEQRQMEAEVRRSEAQLRGIIDNLQDAYVRADLQGRIVMASSSAAHLYGFDAANDMIGLPAESLYADVAMRGAMFEELRATGRVVDYVGRGRKKDGSAFWVSLNAQLFHDDEGAVAGAEGFIRDITERMRTEQDLRENEEILRGLFDNMPSGAAIYEVRGDGSKGSDYIVKGFNVTSLRIEGRTKEEVVGKSLLDLRPAIDQYGLIPVFQRVWQTGEPALFPSSLYVDERFTNWYENRVFRLPSGEIVAVYDDVTERIRAEQALRESEDKFKYVFDHSVVGKSLTSTTGEIHVNDAFCRMLDYTRRELEGLRWQDVTHPDDIAATEHQVAALLSGTTTSLRFDKRYVKRDGSVVWADVSTSLRRDEDGAPLYFMTAVIDITERRRAEQEIRRLNAELESRVQARTAELEAANHELESFAYSVSHDLRAPLRALDGFSQILLDDYGTRLDEEGRSYLDRIRAADQRMGALIDALLELSRLNRDELLRERLDVSALARAIGAELAEAEPGRAVELAIADGLEAHADRRLVQALLANLIGNAWKFTARHDAARIEVGAADAGGERAFYVRDDGAGFDMAYADKLFGAFQRLHSPGEFEGLGIGLATAQRIVRRHGGRVWAEGAVEKGATFWFTLPDAVSVA